MAWCRGRAYSQDLRDRVADEIDTTFRSLQTTNGVSLDHEFLEAFREIKDMAGPNSTMGFGLEREIDAVEKKLKNLDFR